MNVLFVNSNLYGHINPTLGLVRMLAERGNSVSYYCSEQFARSAESAGAKWLGFSEKTKLFLKEYRPTDKHPFYMLMEYMLMYDEAVLPEILDIARREPFDMIICDSLFGGACFLKEIVDIPVVCSHSSFALSKAPVPQRMLAAGFHPQLDHCYAILGRVCARYRIQEPSPEEVFVSRGELNVVYTTREFNGDESIGEPGYLFAGPSLDRADGGADGELPATGGGKLIYVSLGSLNTDHADFYGTCMAAFGDSGYNVWMSVGGKCDISRLGGAPGNFLIKSFFPQLEVLKRADAFITHAGFNSVNEAMYFGVPMLALPLANDQHMVAKRLAALRLGETADIGELTPQALRSKTEALLADAEIKENCLRVSRSMREGARMERAARALEDYAAARKEGRGHGTKE